MQLQLCGGLRRRRVQPDTSDPVPKRGDHGQRLHGLQGPPAAGRREGEPITRRAPALHQPQRHTEEGRPVCETCAATISFFFLLPPADKGTDFFHKTHQLI